MLSQRSHYALRALLILAAKTGDGPLQSWQIAKSANLSPKFLETVLLELKKAGLVLSRRGCKGGYVLGRPAEKISFAEIVMATDGSMALSPCVSEIAYRRCDDCFDEASCSIRKALVRVRDITSDALHSYDLASAAESMRLQGAL